MKTNCHFIVVHVWGDLCSYIIHKELFENASHLRMEERAESCSQEAEKGSPV